MRGDAYGSPQNSPPRVVKRAVILSAPTPTKKCKRCADTKPLALFPPRAKGSQGVAGRCQACVDEAYASGTFACSRCSDTKPGEGFFKGSKGEVVRQPCKECLSSTLSAAREHARIRDGRGPYHLLSDIDAAARKAVCRICGPTHIHATGGSQGCGWRCGIRADQVSAAWYDAKATVANKHAARHWHRLSEVRGAEMRGTCSQCGDTPVRWVQTPGRFICASQRQKQRNAAYQNRRRLLSKYGLTTDDYARMNADQSGKCAICGGVTTRSDSNAGLVVDHCHATGQVRGLLCNLCNPGLGLFRDSPELLIAAAAYLHAWTSAAPVEVAAALDADIDPAALLDAHNAGRAMNGLPPLKPTWTQQQALAALGGTSPELERSTANAYL